MKNSEKHNLKEAESIEDTNFKIFLKSAQNCPYFKEFAEQWEAKKLKEGEIETGVMTGPARTTGLDSLAFSAAATYEIYNAVIRGYKRYMDDSFVRKYTTDSTIFRMPMVEYQELVASMDGNGEFPHTEKQIKYASVDLTPIASERGGKCTWTRAMLEDCTFDVQAEMAEGLGHAIAYQQMHDILDALLNIDRTLSPSGGTISLSSTITWKEFLSVISAIDIGLAQPDGSTKTYGPADTVLVSPDVYWQLADIIQMTNVLYYQDAAMVKRGVIELALGCRIIKESILPAGTVVALNSEKAIMLVTRRSLRIEPVFFPVWNEYGFIGSVRYGVKTLWEGAIQIGQVTPSS